MGTSAEQSRGHPFTTRDISDHYDQFAWAYQRYWGDHIHHGLFPNGDEDCARAQELMVRHCAECAGVAPGMNVADVGCGHGLTTRWLAEKYGCTVLGVTVSSKQLELATTNCQALDGKVRFELSDAEAFAFPPANFDVIWNMESSEHFFDKPAYFRKVAAALKPGGKLMLAAWSGSMEDELIRRIAKIFLCPELWTAIEYRQAIEGAGMKVLSQEQLDSEGARTWDISGERLQGSLGLLAFLPGQFREFVQGIEMIRDGYRTGRFSYTILVAQKV